LLRNMATGQTVATELQIIELPDDARVLSYRPLSDLEPAASYEAVYDDEGFVTSFTTGAARDDEPPALPVVATEPFYEPASPTSSCGSFESRGMSFELEDVEPQRDLVAVDREGMASVVDQPQGELFELRPFPIFLLGRAACVDNWPEVGPGASTSVRFGVFDLAGNFSGWGEEIDVMLEEEPEPAATGCGCQAGPAREGWAGLGPLLGLVAVPRARRRPSRPISPQAAKVVRRMREVAGACDAARARPPRKTRPR
jgi:MYXO-CTERM domain-containing protein